MTSKNPSKGEPSLDEIHSILASPIRRVLLDRFLKGETTTIETMATDLAANDEVPYDDPERLKRNLHHIHLPKLAAAGLIDFDHGTGTIRMNGPLEKAYQVMTQAAGSGGA